MSGQQYRSSGVLPGCMHQPSCGLPIHVSASACLLCWVVTMLLFNRVRSLAVKSSTSCSSPPHKLPMPSLSDSSCSVHPSCSCCSSFAELPRGFVCSGSDPATSGPTPTTSGCCCYKKGCAWQQLSDRDSPLLLRRFLGSVRNASGLEPGVFQKKNLSILNK